MSILSVSLPNIKDQLVHLSQYKGKVLLIVNTASKCGLTPQYEGLENLYKEYKDAGLEILGFPANNFNGQEPGSDAEIQEFCQVKFNTSFPLFKKSDVVGANANPLYKILTAAIPEAEGEGPHRERLKGFGITTTNKPEILWNFEKFIVDKEGVPVARFSPDVPPQDERIVATIKKYL